MNRFCRPGRSRSASLPTPVKGRAWRHRLLRAPGMSSVAAPPPSLKLPGCLMSLTAPHVPSTALQLVLKAPSMSNELLDETDPLFLSTHQSTVTSFVQLCLCKPPLMSCERLM